MLAGLIATISAAIISIFQWAFCTAGLIAGAGCVIVFGGYYVARYAELEELKSQLRTLETRISELHTTNQSMETQVRDFADANSTLREQIVKNQELYETAADRLGDAFRNLQTVHAQIENARGRLDHLIRREASIQATIETENAHLSRIRQDLRTEVIKLQQITAPLLDSVPKNHRDKIIDTIREMAQPVFSLV
jgi:chromosome segregation ATPase